MKSIFFTILVLFSFSINSRGQGAMEKGDILVNLGIGLNSYFGGTAPAHLSAEKALTDEWSVGGGIDYASRTWAGYNYFINGAYTYSAIYLGARGAFHLNKLMAEFNASSNKLDIYAGATLGYAIGIWSQNYTDYWSRYYKAYGYYGSAYLPYGSGIMYGLYLGGKYYFTKNVGAFVELGATGSTNIRLGAAFKFSNDFFNKK